MEGRHLYLRAPEPGDIDILYRWENDRSLWFVSNTLAPFSRFTIEQYVLNASADIYVSRQLRLMIVRKEDPGIPVGCIDLFDFDPLHQRAGIGIMVDQDFRRKGIAGEALGILSEYAFSTLQLHQLYCNIAADNPVSLELFREAGFQICGNKSQWLRDGKHWKDEYLLQLINPNDLSP